MKIRYALNLYVYLRKLKSNSIFKPTRTEQIRILLLQVSLGNMNELLNADYNADKLPSGKHSVWGKGRIAPDPRKTFVT